MVFWESKRRQRQKEVQSKRKFRLSAFNSFPKPSLSKGLELAIYANSGLRDGSMANVSWLQEFPDPVTKICWDNYATLSMKMAYEIGLHEGDVIELRNSDGMSVEVPVHIQPGQHNSVVWFGYGLWSLGSWQSG